MGRIVIGGALSTTGVRHRYRHLVASALAVGDRVELSAREGHHLLRVARRQLGDEVEVITPEGTRYDARIAALEPACLEITGVITSSAADRVYGTVWLGWCRPDVAQTATRMLTELGIERLVFLRTDRIGRIPNGPEVQNRLDRLGRVAAEAQRQCGRGPALSIDGLLDFEVALAEVAGEAAAVLDPRAAQRLSAQMASRRPRHLLIGPEAGFHDAEIQAAVAAGVVPVSIGSRILRVETACVAACTLMMEGHA